MRFLPPADTLFTPRAVSAFLRVTAIVAVRTVAPLLLALFAPLYFFTHGRFAVAIWCIMVVVWILIFGAVELVRASSRGDWEMRLRHVLLSFRKLTNDAITRILAAQASGLDAPPSLHAAFDHDTLMGHIMAAVFYATSQGNPDLEKHFRVTFMEVQEDALWIRYYANSDNEPPATMSVGASFANGQGVAGQAWSRNNMVIVPDVESDIRRGGIFVCKTEQHERFEIKSVVSIPVALARPGRGTTTVIGVLNIDSDQRNYFRDTHSDRRLLEITIRPYIRLIRLLYAVRQTLAHQAEPGQPAPSPSTPAMPAGTSSPAPLSSGADSAGSS